MKKSVGGARARSVSIAPQQSGAFTQEEALRWGDGARMAGWNPALRPKSRGAAQSNCPAAAPSGSAGREIDQRVTQIRRSSARVMAT